MRTLIALLIGVACLLLPSVAAAQTEWDRYQPGQLQTLVKRVEVMFPLGPDTPEEVTLLAASTDFPTRAVVVYTGQVRPISREGATVIADWVQARHEDSTVVSYFRREVLFTEAGREYWLPVQETLVAPMETEVGPGNPLVILATWMGALRKGAELRSVFVVNEFDANVIPRAVDLGQYGKLVLGSPVERIAEVAEPGDQSTRPLRQEVFGGADSIFVTLGPGDSLEGLRFVYGPETTFEMLRGSGVAALGFPRELTMGLPAGVRSSAVWCDRHTRSELQLRSGQPERVHLILTNRGEGVPC